MKAVFCITWQENITVKKLSTQDKKEHIIWFESPVMIFGPCSCEVSVCLHVISSRPAMVNTVHCPGETNFCLDAHTDALSAAALSHAPTTHYWLPLTQLTLLIGNIFQGKISANCAVPCNDNRIWHHMAESSRCAHRYAGCMSGK